MVFYGPWIQGPDYEVVSPGGLGVSDKATTRVEGPLPLGDEINQAIAAVGGGHGDRTFDGTPGAGLTIVRAFRDHAAGTGWVDAEGGAGGGAWGESSDPLLLAPPSYSDPDAVGLEYEDERGVAVGALLDLPPTHFVTPGLTSGATKVSVYAGSVIGAEHTLVDEWVFTDSSAVPTRLLNLTLHMNSATGDVAIRVVAQQSSAWTFASADPDLVGVTVWIFTPVMTYTVRPPRHRFIYDEPVTPIRPRKPICRTYPRDDQGRRSGSRSTQNSNRRGGAYS